MYHFFASDLFFAHATGAVIAFRTTGSKAPNWVRQLLLCGVSLYFLCWLHNFRAIGPLLAVYVLAALALGHVLLMSRVNMRSALSALCCAACMAVLIVVKYNNWLPDVGRLHKLILRVQAIEWIGLSYLTFRAIDYLVNVSQDPPLEGARTTTWLYGCAYLLFFPAYVSGPINRFRPYLDEQTTAWKSLTFPRIRANLSRIALGVIKLLFLARLACSHSILSAEFPGLTVVSFPVLALSLYSYLFYIYFDFSGYCDVAVALADFFEVRIPENFNYPFLAGNPRDFWNRWHVSLTHWMRDFVFFRLMRHLTVHWPAIPELLTLLASSFVTLALVGAWHGQGVNWVFYGLYHAVGFCSYLTYQHFMKRLCPEFYLRLRGAWVYRAVCIFGTFNFVSWGLLLMLPLSALRPFVHRIVG